MKNQLLIVGAGGHGRVVGEIALRTRFWKDNIFFLDDSENIKLPVGLKVIGKSTDVYQYIDDYYIFVAIGNNATRARLQSDLESNGANIPMIAHPNAIIGYRVELGIGTVIMAGAVINCGTVVGKGCILNTGATLDHDNLIEDYVHISPGAHLAGNVKVGKRTWLGVGSAVVNDVVITDGCTVGAGAAVVNNLTESGTYVGVPAKKINASTIS